MRRSTSLVWLFIIVIISALAYTWWSRRPEPPQPIMRPVEVKPEATNPVQTIDTETASQNTLKTKDWQVYTSTGMTVKYPDTYSISTVMSDPLLTGYNIISST